MKYKTEDADIRYTDR